MPRFSRRWLTAAAVQVGGLLVLALPVASDLPGGAILLLFFAPSLVAGIVAAQWRWLPPSVLLQAAGLLVVSAMAGAGIEQIAWEVLYGMAFLGLPMLVLTAVGVGLGKTAARLPFRRRPASPGRPDWEHPVAASRAATKADDGNDPPVR